MHYEEEVLEQIFKLKLPFFREHGQIDKKDPRDDKTAQERWLEVL